MPKKLKGGNSFNHHLEADQYRTLSKFGSTDRLNYLIELENKGWDLEELLEHDLLSKQMFVRRESDIDEMMEQIERLKNKRNAMLERIRAEQQRQKEEQRAQKREGRQERRDLRTAAAARKERRSEQAASNSRMWQAESQQDLNQERERVEAENSEAFAQYKRSEADNSLRLLEMQQAHAENMQAEANVAAQEADEEMREAEAAMPKPPNASDSVWFGEPEAAGEPAPEPLLMLPPSETQSEPMGYSCVNPNSSNPREKCQRVPGGEFPNIQLCVNNCGAIGDSRATGEPSRYPDLGGGARSRARLAAAWKMKGQIETSLKMDSRQLQARGGKRKHITKISKA